MNDQTDQQLLRDFAERCSEAAFTELVRRYVDLVHSAAFRMTCEAHSAEDVTQTVFVTLAQNADRLTLHPVLSGWLHTTAHNLAAKNVRASVRRQNHEQEAATMNELLSKAPDASWEEIAPHLDNALAELSEPDRHAVLLRYFEKQSAPQMAERLGISEAAAQKRVSRAVERLREFFTRRGVTVGSGAIVTLLSAHAVQSAPIGLALAIASAPTLAATSIVATTTTTFAMTTLTKAIVGTTLAIAVRTAVYQTRQGSDLRRQVNSLQNQLSAQSQQTQERQAEIEAGLAALRDQQAHARSNNSELLRLRGELARLRVNSPASNAKEQPGAATTTSPTNHATAAIELPKES
ncbi:MAG TPA: sigma-70 family RNA polymerase sigma factor [Verrucomicrobiae bacterium]|nr:sigma-70 family RNA polymerase sigma factor [Verrucomicrobiae bacterium]